MAGGNEKVEYFYTMLNFLLDTFVPERRIRVTGIISGLYRRFGMTILTG
jgi:hypothetical protein